ncbi:MAG: hypothetical protein LKM43_05400 [Wolbachia endosymbiont of Penenirmus auritus]|nr:hypothetical protein [Wolbachia endosymbiont of Penenirmus auritus]
MNSFEIPLLRNIKYGHCIDDFTVMNFLACPEGLRLRPPLFPIFDIPFAIGNIIVGFYYGNNDTIYLAKKVNIDQYLPKQKFQKALVCVSTVTTAFG